MNIEQAINIVADIDRRLDNIKQFVEYRHQVSGEVVIRSGSWAVPVSIFSADEKTALIERERERLMARRTKLTAVIDMANAALKGIGA
jgi:hypothetical protein